MRFDCGAERDLGSDHAGNAKAVWPEGAWVCLRRPVWLRARERVTEWPEWGRCSQRIEGPGGDVRVLVLILRDGKILKGLRVERGRQAWRDLICVLQSTFWLQRGQCLGVSS